MNNTRDYVLRFYVIFRNLQKCLARHMSSNLFWQTSEIEKFPDSWYFLACVSQYKFKNKLHYWWSLQWISISINKSQEFDLWWIVLLWLNVQTHFFLLIDANWLDSFFNCESTKEFRLSSDLLLFHNEKWLNSIVGFVLRRVKHHFSFNANQLILNKFYIVVDEYY